MADPLAPTRTRLPARADARARGVILLAAIVAIMWLVELIDLVAGDLDSAGIRPRVDEGLIGVALAPFLHAGFGHLIANTVPLLGLGLIVALGGLRRLTAVTAIIALVAGLGTWGAAPVGTLHIGASGIVFGYVTYLIARGLHSRHPLHLAAGLVVLVLFGGMLLSGLMPERGISWQGHLFGALGGLLAARLVHARRSARGEPR